MQKSVHLQCRDPERDFCLRPVASRVRLVRHPTLCKRLHRLVSTNVVRFAEFFIRVFIPPRFAAIGRHPFTPVSDHRLSDLRPFLSCLLLDLPSSVSLLTRPLYRSMCLPTTTKPSSLPSLPMKSWKFFWQIPLSHHSHTIWFRTIHENIPTRIIMHEWVQATFPSPACPICDHAVEDFDHFVFSCPPKIQVWQRVWHTFFSNSVDLSVDTLPLKQAILKLQIPPLSSPHSSSHSASLIIGFTLQSLWRAYWNLIFDNCPFSPDNVYTTLLACIHTANQESFIVKGIPHRPLPPLLFDDRT
ncbi:hypothetical protein BD560DRAFT_369183 [Blakeslea trispora]|nr:hypothetical protein BD560DRAFT_369183 [Blakeslea trispora]